MTTNEIIDAIIAREGGYVDHPDDRGGPTKYGITAYTLARFLGSAVVLPEAVKNLTIDDARNIYRKMYVETPRFDEINNADLRHLCIDSGVNHGPGTAIKWLQKAEAGLAVDGVIGPLTLAAVNAADARRLYLEVAAFRIRFYGWLITRRPSQAVFAAGWMNRVSEFVDRAARFQGEPR